MDELVPARPRNCERELEEKNAELEAKNAENAQLKDRVAELERQLEDAKRPYRIRPHSDMGPGGRGFGP
jgi:uncharacterized protein YigA (DUF484 family)